MSRLAGNEPGQGASAADWVGWYWGDFLPAWVERAHDPGAIGFFDVLDAAGEPVQPGRRTVLAQARLLFTFAHLALCSDNPAHHRAARIAREALPAFRKAPGPFRPCARGRGAGHGRPGGPVVGQL